ncbi:hypothetical protein AAMO2058_000003300 [Amorphochlora amoebiformis]
MVGETDKTKSLLARIALTSILSVASGIQLTSRCKNSSNRRIRYCNLATFLISLFMSIYALFNMPWRVFILSISLSGAILIYAWTLATIQLAIGLSTKASLPGHRFDLRVNRLQVLLWVPYSVFIVVFTTMTISIVGTDQILFGSLHVLTIGTMMLYTSGIALWYFDQVRRMVDKSIVDFLRTPDLLEESITNLLHLKKRIIKICVVFILGGFTLGIISILGGISELMEPTTDRFSVYYETYYWTDDFNGQEIYMYSPIFFAAILMYHSWVKPTSLYNAVVAGFRWIMFGESSYGENEVSKCLSKDRLKLSRPNSPNRLERKFSKSSTLLGASHRFQVSSLHAPVSRRVFPFAKVPVGQVMSPSRTQSVTSRMVLEGDFREKSATGRADEERLSPGEFAGYGEGV